MSNLSETSVTSNSPQLLPVQQHLLQMPILGVMDPVPTRICTDHSGPAQAQDEQGVLVPPSAHSPTLQCGGDTGHLAVAGLPQTTLSLFIRATEAAESVWGV